MPNDMVVLTYKRRRFYDRSEAFHGIEATSSSLDSPKADINGCNVNLSEDNKNVQVNRQFTARIKRAFEESTPKSNEARKAISTEESNKCAVELCSNPLPGIKAYEGGSSSTVDAFVIGHIQADNSSKSVKKVASSNDSLQQSTDSDFLRKTKYNCLEPSSEIKCNSTRPDDYVSRPLDLNENLDDTYNEVYLREKCNAPLLTFSRRAKRKHEIGEVSKSNPKNKDKHPLLSNSRQILLDETYKSEGCSPKVTLTDQANIVGALSRDAELHSLDAVPKDEVFKENELKDATLGRSLRTKIDGKIFEESPVNVKASNTRPFTHIENVPQGPSVSILSVSTPDSIGGCNLVHKDIQMKSTYTDTFVLEKPKNKDLTENSEKELVHNTSSMKGILLNQKQSGVSGSCTYIGNKEVFTTSLPEVLSISAHASTRLNSTDGNKEAMGTPNRKVMEPRFFLNQDCAISLGEKSDIKGKGLDFPEDKLAWKSTKDQNMSFFKQDGAHCKQVSNGNTSRLFVAHASLGQNIPADSINHLNPQQGATFTTRLGGISYANIQRDETLNTSICSNSLGFPLSASSEAPTTVRNVGRMPSGSFNGKTNINDMKFMWHGLSGNSSILSGKQLIDDMLMGSWMCKQREASRIEWSENELDCLWVGVRRHGIGNWSSVLRDSRLFFLESRVAEDLADQWNIEQKKLFNGMLTQPARLNRPYYSPFSLNDVLISKPLHGNQQGRYSSYSDIQRSSIETELSLGDVYLQKENASKRNLNMSGPAMGNFFMEGNQSAGSLSCSYPKTSTWPTLGNQIPPAPKNGRSTPEQSCFVQKNAEELCHEHMAAGILRRDKLPHWLKDVFISPPSASGRHMPPDALANKNPQLNKDQSDGTHSPGELSLLTKSSNRRGLLKRSTTSKLNSSCCKPYMEVGSIFTPDQSFDCARPATNGIGLEQNTVIDLNKKFTENTGTTDSVESDVSSEGTISDDQSSRP